MIDRHFEVLASEKRRTVLFEVLERGVVDRRSVARDDWGSRGEWPEAVELHHVHLPKLEEAGLVDWNRATDEIARGPQFDEIEPLLSVLAENRAELAGVPTVD